MRKLVLAFCLVVLAGNISHSQTQGQITPPSYQFKTIAFPGASTTQIFGINERGDVVGSYVDAAGSTHGFQFAARGVNDDDEIVGGFATAAEPDGGHGFVLRDGKFSQVDFPGSAHSVILGVNEGGNITGSYDLGDINAGIGYFTRQGEFVSFEVPGSAPATTGPHAINDSGQVTGFFTDLRPIQTWHMRSRRKTAPSRPSTTRAPR